MAEISEKMHEKRLNLYRHVMSKVEEYVWEKSDEDGRGGEEKERKTEVEVDGQSKCGLESDEDGCGGERKED